MREEAGDERELTFEGTKECGVGYGGGSHSSCSYKVKTNGTSVRSGEVRGRDVPPVTSLPLPWMTVDSEAIGCGRLLQ